MTTEAASFTPLDSIAGIVARARGAQEAWAALPIYERVRALRTIRRRSLRDAEQAASLVNAETGKPIEEALTAEALSVAELFDWWAAEIEGLLEPQQVLFDPLFFPRKRGKTERVPRGVVGLVTPWNFPLAIPMRTIIPALLAGNAVVFKPSEKTPQVGALIASWFEGLVPPGLLSLVQGDANTVTRIIESSVDAVVFTGCEAAGRKVAELCAHHFVPCSLELGGKDAAIVLADAKLERASRGIVWGAFSSSGQSCSSIERVFVERAIAEPFLRRLVEVTRTLRPGIDYGPVATAEQLERIHAQLQDAMAHGAEVLTGGEPSDGDRMMAPTIVRITNGSVQLMTHETFGPVLPVEVVDTPEQAVVRANQSRFGLTASIWTRSISRAERLARRLKVGVVTINNHGFTAAVPMAPWGGTRSTGWGVTNSESALDFLTRPFFVLTDRSGASRELWWHPYNQTLRSVATAIARVRGGAGFFGRIAAFLSLLWLLPRRKLSDR